MDTPRSAAVQDLPAPAEAPPPAVFGHIPGPRTLPLLGWRANALAVLREPAGQLLRLHQTYGDIVALGPETGAPVAVFAPEYNHLLLTNTDLFYSLDVNDSASPIRMPRNSAAARLLSGIAGMNGPRHRTQRQLLLPGFHRKRVDGLVGVMGTLTEEHIAGWRSGQQIDIAHEMVELTLSLSVSSIIGLHPGEEGREIRALLHTWGKHGLSVAVALLPLDVPGVPYHRFLRLSEQLEAALQEIIALKRRSGVDGGDALSILLQTQDTDSGRLTETELEGHLTTFFTAGHETAASALTWIMFLLAQHPQITSELQEELDGRLRGAAPTLDQLGDLPRLQQVIDEGMRLFPPAVWMLRTTTAPCRIGPYALPEGARIVYSPAVTHRRPAVFPQPNRFRPDRWETIHPTPYEYLPFGAGPRRCLGATLAMTEMRVVLAILLQRFRPVIPPGTRVDHGGTALSVPRGPLPLVLYPRDAAYPAPHVRGNVHALVDLP